jgi:PTS system mannose-specific IIA component
VAALEDAVVGIVLVSHGQMAEGMIDAARMIVGEQQGVTAVTLRESDGIESLTERVAAAVQQVDSGDGVLILVDVFGASPFNCSARVAMQRGKVEVITGMSLPMLLELMVQREGQGLTALTQLARDAGSSCVRTLSDTLARKAGEGNT